MEFLMNVARVIKEHHVEFLVALSGLTVALQGLVRLTPTKKDDGFMERVGQILSKVMDLLKIPNLKRKK